MEKTRVLLLWTVFNALTLPPEMNLGDILQNVKQAIWFAQKSSDQTFQSKADLQIHATLHSTRGKKTPWKLRELLVRGSAEFLQPFESLFHFNFSFNANWNDLSAASWCSQPLPETVRTGEGAVLGGPAATAVQKQGFTYPLTQCRSALPLRSLANISAGTREGIKQLLGSRAGLLCTWTLGLRALVCLHSTSRWARSLPRRCFRTALHLLPAARITGFRWLCAPHAFYPCATSNHEGCAMGITQSMKTDSIPPSVGVRKALISLLLSCLFFSLWQAHLPISAQRMAGMCWIGLIYNISISFWPEDTDRAGIRMLSDRKIAIQPLFYFSSSVGWDLCDEPRRGTARTLLLSALHPWVPQGKSNLGGQPSKIWKDAKSNRKAALHAAFGRSGQVSSTFLSATLGSAELIQAWALGFGWQRTMRRSLH